MIDEDRSGRHRRQHTRLAEHDLTHVVVVADTHHHDVDTFGSLGRRRCSLTTVQRDPRQRFCCRAVEDDEVVTGPLQVARHRSAHDACTEKGDLLSVVYGVLA